MRHCAHPDPILKIVVEQGVGKAMQRARSKLPEFNPIHERVLGYPLECRLELGAEFRAQPHALGLVMGSRLLSLLLGSGVKLDRLHG